MLFKYTKEIASHMDELFLLKIQYICLYVRCTAKLLQYTGQAGTLTLVSWKGNFWLREQYYTRTNLCLAWLWPDKTLWIFNDEYVQICSCLQLILQRSSNVSNSLYHSLSHYNNILLFKTVMDISCLWRQPIVHNR